MRNIFLSLFCSLPFLLGAQEAPTKWALSLDLGNYTASLAVPSFKAFHPGARLGLHYQWNDNSQHRLQQSAYLGYFNHPLFQQAVHLSTEFSYEWHAENGFYIRPLSLGGGYLASFSSLPTLEWDASTQTYTENKTPLRNQWMISLGSEVGYQLGVGPKPTLYLAYRLLIHGVVVQNTVPVIAYSPLMLGIRMPFSKS